jgi:GTP-binding protein
MNAELTHDAGEPREFPSDGLPEVAILGRSNVGKSSLINALVGRRGLARTSGRPGKTRRIFFYRVAGACYLVDLPGYGYAAASRDERRQWKPMVESYLRGTRPVLRGALLVIDLRRGPEDEEHDLLGWLDREGIPAALAFTKSDKLAPSRAAERLRSLAAELALPADGVAAVSSRTGRGLERVGGWIRGWTGVELLRPDGTPLAPTP